MSEQLTVSATFSVLMMAAYVLFGTEAERVPFGPGGIATEQAAPVIGRSSVISALRLP